MMKYDNASMADQLMDVKGSSGIGGHGAHQRMTKKINQFVVLAKRRLERRSTFEKLKKSKRERASRIWKHCSYRHSDFY